MSSLADLDCLVARIDPASGPAIESLPLSADDVRGRAAHGLLAEDGLAGLRDRLGELDVEHVRRGDDDEVDLRIVDDPLPRWPNSVGIRSIDREWAWPSHPNPTTPTPRGRRARAAAPTG